MRALMGMNSQRAHGNSLKRDGEPSRARTCDPLIKSQLLYQLSYRPTTEVRIIRRHAAESSRWVEKLCCAFGNGFGVGRIRAKKVVRYITKSSSDRMLRSNCG